MHELLHFATNRAQELVDNTEAVKAVVRRSGIAAGLINVFAQPATATPTSKPAWWQWC